eukprot:TRINITY_DN3161_c0_g2_i3.p1 TRINITY_DN3161_c0_g2~~TRINITY_DN3161_c0_g2_i3.p1  ORF type:complete len:306 (+),score=82.50 TRINITY_DN3161_c0_g2_i3:1219-2136(+)
MEADREGILSGTRGDTGKPLDIFSMKIGDLMPELGIGDPARESDHLGGDLSKNLSMSEEDIDAQELDEGYRNMKTVEVGKQINGTPEILTLIKAENIELKEREAALKSEFERLKQDYAKFLKEKSNMESRKNGLKLREASLQNETKILNNDMKNFMADQEELEKALAALDELNEQLEKMKREEKDEIEEIKSLNEQIVFLSKLIQNERKAIQGKENARAMAALAAISSKPRVRSPLQSNGPQLGLPQKSTSAATIERRRICSRYGLDERANLELVYLNLSQQCSHLEATLAARERELLSLESGHQ